VPIAPLRLCVLIGLVSSCWAGAGCGAPDVDVSQTPEYASAIGSHYRAKTDLWALGLYSTDGSRRVAKIWVSPFPGTGPEVAFRRKIPAGQDFKVVAVRKAFVLLENGIQCVVATDGLDLPPGLEIIIPLYGEFRQTGGFLDDSRFERVATSPQ